MLEGNAPSVVLVVEDTPELRDLYAEALHDAGLRVELAVDGVEGVEKAIGLRPAVIVMDVDMPRQDGFTAIRVLRQDVRTSSIPVIVCTSEPVEEQARRSGCAFLGKPCSLRALVSAVQAQLAP